MYIYDVTWRRWYVRCENCFALVAMTAKLNWGEPSKLACDTRYNRYRTSTSVSSRRRTAAGLLFGGRPTRGRSVARELFTSCQRRIFCFFLWFNLTCLVVTWHGHYFIPPQTLFFTFSSRRRQRRRQQQHHSSTMWCVSELDFMIISLRAKSKKLSSKLVTVTLAS
jgi:hypothetical protein